MASSGILRHGPTVLVGFGLAAAAAWRGALSPGILLFLGTTLIWTAIRRHYEADPLHVEASLRVWRERCLVILVALGVLYLPAIAIATPLLDFAAYSASVWQLTFGVTLAAAGVLLFWRSHADLGRNWSPVLKLRASHGLVTGGVYTRIRHPMYAALFLIFGAQAAFLGNGIAGPAGLVAFTLLYLDRVGPEERMMADRFDADWERYADRTARLLPTMDRAEPGTAA